MIGLGVRQRLHIELGLFRLRPLQVLIYNFLNHTFAIVFICVLKLLLLLLRLLMLLLLRPITGKLGVRELTGMGHCGSIELNLTLGDLP